MARYTNAQVMAELAEIRALLVASAPAKTEAPAVVEAPVRRVADQPKAAGKALTRGNREQFVRKAPWAKGLSTRTIAAMCVEDPTLLPKGFRIGGAYEAMFTA